MINDHILGKSTNRSCFIECSFNGNKHMIFRGNNFKIMMLVKYSENQTSIPTCVCVCVGLWSKHKYLVINYISGLFVQKYICFGIYS